MSKTNHLVKLPWFLHIQGNRQRNTKLPEQFTAWGKHQSLRNWKAHCTSGVMGSNMKNLWCLPLKASRPRQLHGSQHGWAMDVSRGLLCPMFWLFILGEHYWVLSEILIPLVWSLAHSFIFSGLTESSSFGYLLFFFFFWASGSFLFVLIKFPLHLSFNPFFLLVFQRNYLPFSSFCYCSLSKFSLEF